MMNVHGSVTHMATTPASGNDPRSLQELAVDIVQDIHKLATGLAHAGAPPKVTQQIEQTSELYGGIAKALAAGPVGQQSPGGGPQAAPQGPPPQMPGAQQAPGPGGPQAGYPAGQGPAHGDLQNTIADMHRTSVNAAVRSGGR